MYKIGVIGDKNSILAFKALGLDVFPCEKDSEAQKILHRIAKENYAIIYITESIYIQIREEVDRYKEARLPAIIPIPGREGSLGIGMQNVKKSVERAVGADILFGGE